MVSSGAPIREEVVKFFSAVMECPFVMTYGLSECSGVVTATL
jgi:long-subunit acyl-CoA synthetase (AMP-forming)